MSDQDKARQEHFGTRHDPVFYATTEPLRVYRQFFVPLGMWHILPVFHIHQTKAYAVDGSWTEASCRAPGFPDADTAHEVPGAHCGCGFYGWYQPDRDFAMPAGDRAFGVMEVAGRMVLGTSGLRAERARVLALEALTPTPMLALPEGSTIRLYGSREELVRDFPPSDWSALLDEPGAA